MPGPRRKIHYWYDNGFLTAVPGYAQSIGYDWNGMIDKMEHATGVIVRSPNRLTEYRDGDLSGMARPRRIHTWNADSNWDSGTYSYDGAGDITKIGPNWYLKGCLERH